MIVVCILKHVYLLAIMKTSCYFTPPLDWLVDHERVCMYHKVVNPSGSIMEQRTASKHGGNVLTALISCQIFIGPMLTLFTGICYLLLWPCANKSVT